MLMNASKSDDSYTKYSGVGLENLIKAIMLDSAMDITVYSPDGFATYHPFGPSTNPNSYHVFGIYPAGTFYYNEHADIAKYPVDTKTTPLIKIPAGVITVRHRRHYAAVLVRGGIITKASLFIVVSPAIGMIIARAEKMNLLSLTRKV